MAVWAGPGVGFLPRAEHINGHHGVAVVPGFKERSVVCDPEVPAEPVNHAAGGGRHEPRKRNAGIAQQQIWPNADPTGSDGFLEEFFGFLDGGRSELAIHPF